MIAIAIDGPSGAGKSTLSRALAEALGYLYVDTGALYRAIGLAALRAGVPTKDAAALQALLPAITLELRYVDGEQREGRLSAEPSRSDGEPDAARTAPGREQRVFLGDEDVSDAIRTEAVGMAASDVSAHQPVRDFLLETQRRLARENNVIMDGRDIGTVVLPDAGIKIFLTATAEERAARRTRQLQEKGEAADYATVLADVKLRDYNDSHRAAAPLKQADDAVLVDSTGESFDESLARLLKLIKEKRGAQQ
ncbi:MAG: (d)CMP kinase [Ruminococcaceae bacterium]|nr:(d)CMP kinase [Oscillospiraceae bacterium]